MHLEETMISSESIYKGKIIDVTKDIVKLENDKEAVREVVHHPGGVSVVPLTEDDEVILVRQFRYPHHDAIIEIPAGKLNPGEDHYACGLRELLEETGCVPDEYTYLGACLPTPAYDTEVIHIYLAKGLKTETQKLDEDEFLDIIKMPLSEAVEMVMQNKIQDAKSQIGILKAWFLQNQK